MYGIRAPGALSFRPFWNCMKHVAANRSLFLGGSEMLGRTSTPSGGRIGLTGRLISRSPKLGVVEVLLGVDGRVAARWILSNSIELCLCGAPGYVRGFVFAGADGMAAGADSTVTSSLSDMASMAEAVQQRLVGGREGK
jgi:hypothetical protein